jgi:protein-S-isoprenylcysteine O-methyltransferase Ste14
MTRKVILFILASFLVLAAFFFLTAGTLDYWEAWVYLFILFIPMTGLSFYMLRHDPALLERRLQFKERRKQQKGIIAWSYPIFLLAFLLPGLDKRFGWTNTPIAAIIIAQVLVLAGYAIVIWVFRENSYASRIIEVQSGQKVVDTGPYAIVRHPMYLGVGTLYMLSPLALGSWLAVIPALPLLIILYLRIRDEEVALARDLPGYSDYMQKVRYRLIPGIW